MKYYLPLYFGHKIFHFEEDKTSKYRVVSINEIVSPAPSYLKIFAKTYFFSYTDLFLSYTLQRADNDDQSNVTSATFRLSGKCKKRRLSHGTKTKMDCFNIKKNSSNIKKERLKPPECIAFGKKADTTRHLRFIGFSRKNLPAYCAVGYVENFPRIFLRNKTLTRKICSGAMYQEFSCFQENRAGTETVRAYELMEFFPLVIIYHSTTRFPTFSTSFPTPQTPSISCCNVGGISLFGK